MLDIDLELMDLPILEFYPDALESESASDSPTEIYIPVR